MTKENDMFRHVKNQDGFMLGLCLAVLVTLVLIDLVALVVSPYGW